MPSYEVDLNVTVFIASAEDESEAVELAIQAVEFTPAEEVTSCSMGCIRQIGAG